MHSVLGVIPRISQSPAVSNRLLVVADDPGQLAATAELVAALGYLVDVAEGRGEAERFLAAGSFALVVVSAANIAGQGGKAFLKLIRAAKPETGIIAFVDRTDHHSCAELLDSGVSDCLELPLRRDALAAKISRVLHEIQLRQAQLDELQTLSVLNGLLQLSMEECSFQEMLQRFLVLITSFPFLGLNPQGAVLLVDEKDPRQLVMAAQHNLALPLQEICAVVPFGRCLCGRAAANGELLFVNHVDERHENHFAGMTEHGHYCVPFKATDGKLLGVFTLYVPGNFVRRLVVEETLLAVAASLSGIIRHQQITRSVAEREARYHAITDAATDGIVMMDEQGRISFLNPATERMFGYSAAEAIGQNLHTLLVPPRYSKEYQPALAHFWATGQGAALGRTIEVEGRHRNGHELPIELSLSALRHKDSWQAVAIIRDISERKRHDAEKERLNRKLQQAYKMEAIGTLAGGIAHDYNNLLTAILGFSELVKDVLPEESQAFADLNKVVDAGKRARDLTRQILAFSRQSEQEKIPVKLQLILKEALKLLRASIPSTIAMEQEIDLDCPSILADPGQLHQIIMNLCTNAYQAMRDGVGTLRVGLERIRLEAAAAESGGISPGEFIQLTVVDNGPGIPSEVIPRIFDPFFTTKPQGDGSGMGLAIVHGIVAELGGMVQVHSAPGQGTEFRVLLPVAAAFDLNQKQTGPSGAEAGNEHILLVDDVDLLLEIGSRNLSRYGYEVTACTSSLEALIAFQAKPDKFDLVLTDQAMPNMTGMELAREILKIRAVPIILLTGFTDAGTAGLAKEAGISEVLTKPIELNDLTQAIRRHLRLQTEG
ncbi:MAG: response regulator [Desulfobulbaceae bacterium]|nr:response regulator [Desulfobulbaceae bacterium]